MVWRRAGGCNARNILVYTGLDINWVGGWEKFSTPLTTQQGWLGGWEKFSTHSSDQQLPRNFPEDVGLLTGPLFF